MHTGKQNVISHAYKGRSSQYISAEFDGSGFGFKFCKMC